MKLAINLLHYFMNDVSRTSSTISQLIPFLILLPFTASPHPNHVGRACLKLKVYVRPPGKSRSSNTHTHTCTSAIKSKKNDGGLVCTSTHGQSGICGPHQFTSHHPGCERDLLSLRNESRRRALCGETPPPSLSTTRLTGFAHKKQESNLIINLWLTSASVIQ